ncbi:MAG: hypothetical protein COW30_12715 [Rhodospirillales bacterium CG15_BIG_FIL_POST_REV_8_21_14_020_66_15]|nr:MAG: hypothetical protein COW30_12715 [Rhodospirillales bacterium CG15_BIG_FIL_POST_REV_8_21_14_020_66_15]
MWNEDNRQPSGRRPRGVSVDDELIHAYVDDMLPPRQRLEVDEYLAAHPEEASRVADILEQSRGFHRLFDGRLGEPLPRRLQDLEDDIRRKMGRRTRGRRRVRVLMQCCYTLVLVTGGLVIGWSVPMPALETEIVAALTGTRVNDRADAARINSGLKPIAETGVRTAATSSEPMRRGNAGQPKWAGAPDLRNIGFTLLSTRIIRGGGPQETAQLVYESERGGRVTLYLAKNAQPREKQVTLTQEGAVSILVWNDENRSFTMVSEVGRETMLAIGKTISDALVLSAD